MCQFNFEGTVTKDINTVKCFVNIYIPDIKEVYNDFHSKFGKLK